MREPLPITDGLVIPATDLEYETSRSGGPGGQAVNTTDSRVRLRFALAACEVLNPRQKARIREAHPAQVTESGELVLTSDVHRSQRQNWDEVRERLVDIIRRNLRDPRPRRATKPTRSSQQRRLQGKKGRSTVKENRKRVSEDG